MPSFLYIFDREILPRSFKSHQVRSLVVADLTTTSSRETHTKSPGSLAASASLDSIIPDDIHVSGTE